MEIRPDETLSVTDIQRRVKEVFERIESGQQDQFVVLRNNGIAAGFLPVKRYEALIDELEDLRIDAIAAERATTFDPAKAITHEEMLAHFSASHQIDP